MKRIRWDRKYSKDVSTSEMKAGKEHFDHEVIIFKFCEIGMTSFKCVISFHYTVLVIAGGKGDTTKDVEIYPPSATCIIPSFPDTGKLSASSKK